MITTLSHQSILDLSLQHCGSLEAAYALADGNGVSISDDLITGEQLLAPKVMDKDVTLHYGVNSIQPATHITNAEINDILSIGEGIEFWAIEFDFMVS
ncbi:MAG: hypothetical protein MJZ84_07550 [Paludibacteraceae bacterium]|nr:hypothetical protein [Paludibacteraceae bacterium]